MAGANNIRAGRAYVELGVGDKLTAGLKSAQKRLRAFGAGVMNIGTKLAGVGAAMTAPLLGAAKHFASYGDEVAKMSKRTGLSVEALSELRFVASQTGTEFSSLEMAFRKMQRSIFDAGRGLSTQKDALDALGVTFDDLKNLKPEEQFKVLAEQLGKVENDTEQAAISMMLFGRTGTNLIPMFEAGAEGITQLQQEARALGLTMSKEDAQAAEEFTDAMDALWKTVKMGVFNVGSALAPLLQEMAQSMTDTVVAVSDWIKSNRDLIVTVLQVAAGILALGIGLVAFGAIVKVGAMALGGIVAIVKVATIAFSVFGAVIGFLVSPIGMVIAALGALGAYTLTATEAGGKALGWFGEKFGQLKEDGIAAYGGIVKALKSGDMGLAAKILWLTLKMWWKRGVGWLTGLWVDFKNFFIKIGIDAFTGLLLVGSKIWGGLEAAWAHTVAFFGNLWDGFVFLFKATWTSMVKWAKKAWTWIKGLFDDSTSESRERAYAMIDREADAAIAKAKDSARKKIVQRNRERAMKLRRIEDEDQARQLAILTKNRQWQDARAKRQAHDEQEIADDIAGARQAWADAVQEAHDIEPVRKADDGPGTLESPEKLLGKVKGVVAGLGDGLSAAADKISVVGTFSGAALGLMGGGTAVDRIAKATEDTARHTKSLTKGKGAKFK